jgi:hypothetical protein
MEDAPYCTQDVPTENLALNAGDQRVSTRGCTDEAYPLTCAVHFLCPVYGTTGGYRDIQLSSNTGCCPDTMHVQYKDGTKNHCVLKVYDA